MFRSFFCLFLILFSGLNCHNLPLLSHRGVEETFWFAPQDFNYFESSSPSDPRPPLEEPLVLKLSLKDQQARQATAWIRLGCSEIVFALDEDFVVEEEELPFRLKGDLEILGLEAFSEGSAFALGRIAFFFKEQESQKVVGSLILDQVASFDRGQEQSVFHQKKFSFHCPVKLKPQVLYTFYIELLGKLDLFKAGNARVEIHSHLESIQIQPEESSP